MSDPAYAQQMRSIAAQLDLVGEHGMAKDAREMAEEHTGLTASWCPRCGACTCPDPLEGLDDPSCPLHSPSSPHARNGELA
jgi:hypothetical protein